MTAFSGGNRWVGVVALAEPPSSTPLHKMATFRRAMGRRENIDLGDDVTISKRRFCAALRQLAAYHAAAENFGRATYYFDLAARVNRHGADKGEIAGWVLTDVERQIHDSQAGSNRQAAPTRRRSFASGKPTAAIKADTWNPPARNTVVIDDTNHPHLPDPGAWADAIPMPDSLVDLLSRHGWTATHEPARLRWLRIACMHSSYLYERERILSSGVNARLLKSFEEVGKRWLALTLLDALLADRPPQGRGEQSTALAKLKSEGESTLDKLLLPLGPALLGKGETAVSQKGASRARSAVHLQVLGLVALMGGVEAIISIARSLYRAIPRDRPPVRDWRTLFDQELGRESVQWEVHEDGPDHDKHFIAQARDQRGRTATGEGRSRKDAMRNAAEAFLRQHLPVVVRRAETAIPVTTPRQALAEPLFGAQLPEPHRHKVTDLRYVFDLPQQSEPWLSQALIHRSWTYENRPAVARLRQEDNGRLAHHGSVVMDALCTHEAVLSLAATNQRPNEDEARTGTPEAAYCERLFDDLAIGGAVLLSYGQSANPDVAKADVAQAVLAVVWRYRGASLLRRRPSELHERLKAFAPVHDGFSELVRRSSPYGIEVDAVTYATGPDHNRRHQADLEFSAESGQALLVGESVLMSKTGAKIRTAITANDLIMTYHERSKLSTDESDFISFYVWSQIAGAQKVEPRSLRRCVLQGHLGLSMLTADNLGAFRLWAEATAEIVGDITGTALDDLRRFYERCLSDVRRGSFPVTTDRVAALTRWLSSLDPETPCGSSSILPIFAPFANVSPSEDPSHALHVIAGAAGRRPLQVPEGFDEQEILLDTAQCAAVTMLIHATDLWSGARTAIEMEAGDGETLVLVRDLELGFEQTVGPLAELLAELSPSVACYLDQRELLVRVAADEASNVAATTPIEEAAREAIACTAPWRLVATPLLDYVPPIVQHFQAFRSAQARSLTADRTNRYRYLAQARDALDAMAPFLAELRRLTHTIAAAG